MAVQEDFNRSTVRVNIAEIGVDETSTNTKEFNFIRPHISASVTTLHQLK